MKKATPLIVLVVLAIVIGGGYLAYTKLMTKPVAEPTGSTKKKINEPANVIPVADRPYLYIHPEADGKNVTIVIDAVKKEATSVDFELEYQSGSLLQGAFGLIELTAVPARKTILLGSCSAGGKCTYHTDVKGGGLLTRYAGPENYVLKSDWKYIENKAKEAAMSSKDAKFQMTADSLAKQAFVIIFNAPGYPEGLAGTPVSDPYTLRTSSQLSGKGQLVMRANEEGSLKIMGYDGSKWHEFTGTVEGKMITAQVDLMELYVAVK